jgi:hypothetical protein
MMLNGHEKRNISTQRVICSVPPIAQYSKRGRNILGLTRLTVILENTERGGKKKEEKKK